MKIFYDHQAFSSQNYGGVSRIFSELLMGIPEASSHKVHLSLLLSNNIYLKQKAIPHFNFLPGIKIPRKQGMIYRINELYNRIDIKRDKFDLYHPTYYDPGLIAFVKNRPIVATFHDMTQERLGGQFKELQNEKNILENKKLIAQKATHIIAVSENTKKDVVEILGIHPDKITVVHLGNSFAFMDVVSEKDNAIKPYILYVGNRGLYKNFIPFLKAITGLLVRYDIEMKCAGGGPFTEYENSVLQKLGISNLVHVEASTSDSKLAILYSNALAFTFPSLYEGFGIPVLEAFACNCPCVISNVSSLPEVAKDAAIYFDPNNSFSINNAVEKVITNATLRETLISKGKERLKHFSWEKHVSETIAVYEKL